MVSFCDIPLSQATQHMQTYGNYAVGLTKEWGIRKGIAPVLYSYPGSVVAHSIGELYALDIPTTREMPDGERARAGKATDALITHIARLLGLLKAYEGPFFRRNRMIPHVRFYNEREWRFLPPGLETMVPLTREEYSDFTQLRAGNEALWNLPALGFEPSDIKYIVVASEAEILPMIREVERIKEKYSTDEVKLLSSRIISASQIQTDF